MICRKCHSETGSNFCPDCGNPVNVVRIDRKYIAKELGSVLNFDKGILFTIKELFIRPGQNIIDFIHYDRNRLVKPVVFLIICSLAYTLAQRFLQFEDAYVNAGGFGESALTNIFSWIQANYGYANILMAVFIALWIKVLFRRYEYNIFEILILLCFVMGIGMLIYSVFGILESLTELRVLHFGGMAGVVYCSWAIGQFFDKQKKVNYVKGFLAYLLGMTMFFFVATILGIGVDLLQKA